jgi:hypothetical protein
MTLRIAPVFRVGVVETTGIVRQCGRPVTPKDFEKIHTTIRAVCPACHVDLVSIETRREE